MKRINEIEKNLEAIQPKLDLGTSDWTKEEKAHIEQAYFEITKVSVGRGRAVDIGCAECVQSAVNIIKNYQALVAGEEKAPKGKLVKMPDPNAVNDWKASAKTIQAEADRLQFKFTKAQRSKDQRIAALEAHIATLPAPTQEEETEDEEDDLLGAEYTAEQLCEIIKAKTGEEMNPDEHTVEELLEIVNSYEDEETDDE